MSDLYLVAHRVRGEPAFDVAERMDCPMCPDPIGKEHCFECNDEGYWWIIPTSGHRAYPYWSVPLKDIDDQYELDLFYWKDLSSSSECWPPEMPLDLPDHYPPRHSSSPSLDISTLLAPAVKVKIERRF